MDLRAPSTSRFALLMLFFWGGIAAIEAFMVPYLTGVGFSEKQAGLIMAAIFFVSIGTQPLWGYIADRTNGHRWIIAGTMLVAILSMLALRGSGAVFGLVLACVLVYSLTANSMPALIDSWIMQISGSGFPVNYGVARGFGSLGFAATAMVLGFVLERFGLPLMFVIYAVLALLVIGIVLSIRTPRPVSSGSSAPSDAVPGQTAGFPIRAVLSNGPYLLLLVSIFFLFLGTRAAMIFLPLRVYQLGGTNVHVGWVQSLRAASEIPFMFVAAYVLRRVKPRLVLLLAMCFFVLRLILTRVAPTPTSLVAVQLVQGIAVGFLVPGSVHYIDRIAPAEFRSLFQTLAPSIYFGLASVIAGSVGGVFLERFGLDALYTVAPAVAGVGVILFGGSLVMGARRRSS